MIGAPLAMLGFLVWEHRRGWLDLEATRQKYGLLFQVYRPSRFFWEFVVLARRVLLVGLNVVRFWSDCLCLLLCVLITATDALQGLSGEDRTVVFSFLSLYAPALLSCGLSFCSMTPALLLYRVNIVVLFLHMIALPYELEDDNTMEVRLCCRLCVALLTRLLIVRFCCVSRRRHS